MKHLQRVRLNTHSLFLVASILTVFVYSFGFPGPFTYDDVLQIVNRRGIHELSDLHSVIFNGLRQIRVWQNLTFAVNWAMSPGLTWSFKVFNVLLHILNGFLLFQWLKRCLSGRVQLALWTTVIFLLHPLQSESVTYVMGRTGLIQGFFYLLALGWYSKYRFERFGGLLAILVASLFAKETCALIPLLLLGYEVIINKSEIKNLNWRRWVVLFLVPFLLFPIYLVLKDPISMYENTTGFNLYPMFGYLCAQFYYLVFYPVLFLYPPYQSIIHSFPSFTPLRTAIALWGAIGFSAVIFIAVTQWRKKPIVSFFIFFFFILVLPTSGFFQMINPFAEYRLYLSNIAYCLALAWLVCFAFQKIRLAQVRLILGAAVILVLSFFTYRNAKIWSNGVSIYENGIKNYPNEHGILVNLGIEYSLEKRLPEARAAFAQAREARGSLPGYIAKKMYLIAWAYFEQGNYAEALSVIDEIESDPNKDEPIPLDFYDFKREVYKALELSWKTTPMSCQ